MEEKKKNLLSKLIELFFVFCKVGAITFGGGLAMLPILEKELIDKRHWTTKEQLMDYYAIGQVTPGIIAVNVSTFIGYTRCGILGGVIATLGVVFPSLVIITLISFFLENFSQIIWVQKALAGINVAVAALLTSILWKFIKQAVKTWKNICGILLVILSFVAIVFFKFPTSLVIVFGALCGIITYVITQRSGKK